MTAAMEDRPVEVNPRRRPRPSDIPCHGGGGPGHLMRRDPAGKRTWVCTHCGLRWPFNEAGDP